LLPGTTFGMNSIGYAERVFSVFSSEFKSSARVWSSNATFSRTVPKRCDAAQISGSAFSERRMTFA